MPKAIPIAIPTLMMIDHEAIHGAGAIFTSTSSLFDCAPSQPIPAAHTAPPAISMMPATNRIASARVSSQLLPMLRLNRLTAPRTVISNR
jgi:hypothetical protein